MDEKRNIQKIALVLAGGVSLGSYEAGVLTELFYALETLNQRADGPKYVLDVMSGASAGGMTAALAARIMLYNFAEWRGDLFTAWVKEIDLRKLLGQAEMPSNALFSKAVTHAIAQEYIVAGTDQTPLNQASFLPDNGKLHLSLALSNMQGIDYRFPYYSSRDQSFVSTFFSDMARFTIDTAHPQATDWQKIGETAIACGNFPIAFKPHTLRRKLKEECFIDGGFFNNEPIREAIQLAKEADGGQVDSERIFILVDPNMNVSYHTDAISPDGQLKNHLMRMGRMIWGESTAYEWTRDVLSAQRKNTEIGWRDELVEALTQLINSASFEQLHELNATLRHQAQNIVEHKQKIATGKTYSAGYLNENLTLIAENQASSEAYRQLAAHPEKCRLFHALVFALDHVAGLQRKSAIRLEFIGVEKKELAGKALASFGGFFEQDWRAYDFQVGRRKARDFLRDTLKLDYPPEALNEQHAIPAKWQGKLPDVTLHDTDPELRKALRERVLDISMSLMREFGIPGIVCAFIRALYLRTFLNKELLLEDGCWARFKALARCLWNELKM